MSETAIVTVQEGVERLATLELFAEQNFHNSQEAFDKALMALYEISTEKLWEYAKDEDDVMLRDYKGGGSFETYLGWFCTRNGISRSSVQQHLKTVRTWIEKLERPREELMGVGVRRAGPIAKLVKYDGRSGQVEVPDREVIDSLPPLDLNYESQEEEFLARANVLVDEVLVDPAEPLLGRDVRKAMTIDVDSDASEVNFFESDDGVWFQYETGDDMGDGVLLSSETLEALPEVVFDKVMSRLRVMRL